MTDRELQAEVERLTRERDELLESECEDFDCRTTMAATQTTAWFCLRCWNRLHSRWRVTEGERDDARAQLEAVTGGSTVAIQGLRERAEKAVRAALATDADLAVARDLVRRLFASMRVHEHTLRDTRHWHDDDRRALADAHRFLARQKLGPDPD